LSAPAQRAAAEAACDRLLALLVARGELADKVVAAYVAVRGELDPASAIEGLRGRGARIALPRAQEPTPGEARLSFECVEPGTALRPGKFGIPEPAEDARLSVEPDALDVVILPGLAFDADGRRLGSGGGYYDATFRGSRRGSSPLLMGFAYDFQIVDLCPAEPHDVAVDLVVTETRVLGPGAAPVEAHT
jgi:5-formyltetrahydrofolate cyclo-ligase